MINSLRELRRKGQGNNSSFTFDAFIQALHCIASHGYEKLKDDISMRMQKLYKHIYEVMSRTKISPGAMLKQKLRLVDSKDRNKALNNDGSGLFVLSNRSGASTKSSRARSKNNNQGRRSKKRKSSHRKRGRRLTNDRHTPGLNHSFLNSGVNDSKNSLPALSAIYGNSFASSKQFVKRNSSGLAGIDLTGNKKKKAFNLEKVNQTLDVKMYEKNNSFSLVGPNRLSKEYYTNSNKKSPTYGKRNLSMGSNKTYDERNKSSEFLTINPLDFEARMSLIKQSNLGKINGLRNNRYKLHSLMQKKRSGSRRKSSNSKKRGQSKKITSHYKNKFNIDTRVRSRPNDRKKQLQMKSRLNKKLIGINSADEYKESEEDINDTNNEAAADESCEYDIPEPGEKLDLQEEKSEEKEEMISNNPEDCKYTIFSGEGEILGTAGETKETNYEEKRQKLDKLSSEDQVKILKQENKALKAYIGKIMKAFAKFKHNQSINVERNSIKIDK